MQMQWCARGQDRLPVPAMRPRYGGCPHLLYSGWDDPGLRDTPLSNGPRRAAEAHAAAEDIGRDSDTYDLHHSLTNQALLRREGESDACESARSLARTHAQQWAAVQRKGALERHSRRSRFSSIKGTSLPPLPPSTD
jgi:hypothetical protein